MQNIRYRQHLQGLHQCHHNNENVDVDLIINLSGALDESGHCLFCASSQRARELSRGARTTFLNGDATITRLSHCFAGRILSARFSWPRRV